MRRCCDSHGWKNDIADLRRTDYKTDGVGREIMFERFFPDEYVVSTYVIPFERLYEESWSILL